MKNFNHVGSELQDLQTENINGTSVQSHEMNIETNELLRYYKIRYKKTVAGSGCQFIELSFSGNGGLFSKKSIY